jgi:hypothetical protein
MPIGGQILHIYGLGFDAHVNYTCTFTDRSSPTHKAESTGSVTNSTYVTCATVLWLWPKTVDAVLKIFDNGIALPLQTLSCNTSDFCVFLACCCCLGWLRPVSDSSCFTFFHVNGLAARVARFLYLLQQNPQASICSPQAD